MGHLVQQVGGEVGEVAHAGMRETAGSGQEEFPPVSFHHYPTHSDASGGHTFQNELHILHATARGFYSK